MATKERAADRGTRRGRELYLTASREIRQARTDRALSLEEVAGAVGLSPSAVSRIERGLVPSTSLVRLAELHAVVGLELSARSFPGATPLRDAGHASALAAFRASLHQSWRWATEVPLPIAGDQRAWDGYIALPTCRYGIEVEMGPTDAQALVRRLALKERDGGVDGVILVLPRTRRIREFLVGASNLLAPAFPVDGNRALKLLATGIDPGGSAVVVIRR